MSKKLDYQEARLAIEKDIENGVYAKHNSVKRSLNQVSEKLLKLQYVINADRLTFGEERILKENGYM